MPVISSVSQAAGSLPGMWCVVPGQYVALLCFSIDSCMLCVIQVLQVLHQSHVQMLWVSVIHYAPRGVCGLA